MEKLHTLAGAKESTAFTPGTLCAIFKGIVIMKYELVEDIKSVTIKSIYLDEGLKALKENNYIRLVYKISYKTEYTENKPYNIKNEIQKIAKCKQIEELIIDISHLTENTICINELSKLPNLKILCLIGGYCNKYEVDFSLFTNLEEVEFDWQKKGIANFDKLTNLKKARIEEYSQKNMLPFRNCTKLEKLTIRNVVLQNLEGIENCISLKYLSIIMCGKLRSIKGIEGENVFTLRNNVDIEVFKEYLEKNGIKDVSVIGGGFVGIECAESLADFGYNVSIVEAQNQILMPFDYDMVQILHKELYDHKINLVLGDSLTEIKKNEIVLGSGKTIKSQAVLLSIGIAPETGLAKDCGLEIGKTGAILVNQHWQTSDPHIYAIGDAIEVTHFLTRQKTRLAMAGPTQRQARGVADHIMGRTVKNKGVIGSGCIKVFSMNAARTGLSERECIAAGIEYDFAYLIPKDKVGLMPDANAIPFKLIFEVPSGRILGAQSVGEGNIDKRIDVIAAMITMNATLDDLKELELCYSPIFSNAKDVTNMAALVGLNLLNGEYEQVRLPEVRKIVENKEALIIDCREENEYEAGHIEGAVNIPLSQFRDRLNEIPKDKPVVVHCLSSQRSYMVTRDLRNRGWTNVKNMVGSFMGLSLFEYFNDVTSGRKPIITNYKFNFKA